jgi:hypothetical protein
MGKISVDRLTPFRFSRCSAYQNGAIPETEPPGFESGMDE